MIAASFSLFAFRRFGSPRQENEKIVTAEVAPIKADDRANRKDDVPDWRISESFFWGLPPFN